MIIKKITDLSNQAIEDKKSLKERVEKGELTDKEYSIELMKLLNKYRESVQLVISTGYHYLFTQD